MIEDLERLRRFLGTTLSLLRSDLRLSLIATSAVGLTISLLPLVEATKDMLPHPVFIYLLALAVCGPAGFARVAMTRAFGLAMRGAAWSSAASFRSARSRWKQILPAAVIDAAGTLLCVLVAGYPVIGSLAGMLWWTMSALATCGIASGLPLSQAWRRGYELLTTARFELLGMGAILNSLIGLGLAVSFHWLDLTLGTAAAAILVLLPLRDIAFQAYIAVVYHHLAPLEQPPND